MASAYITEYNSLGVVSWGGSSIPLALEPSSVDQKLTISGTHAPSAAFGQDTTIIRVHVDAICSLTFGTAPVATTGSRRMAANATEYFAVPKGQSFKVSVIANT